MIAFVGSVFSPYYAWSGRGDPENHVAVNVALYAPGRRFWAMTERGRRRLTRGSEAIRVGASGLRWEGDALTIEIDEVALPWPTANWAPKRLRGRIRLAAGPIAPDVYGIDREGRHFWRPIAPRGRISVDIDVAPAWKGDGYLDCNWGVAPLEAGFVRWDWARGRLANRDAVILYDLQEPSGGGAQLALRIDCDGVAEPFDPPQAAALGRGFWGVESSVPSEPGWTAAILRQLEDTPFYRRALVRAHVLGQDVELVHETFSGRRYASPVVKAMLPFRMPRRR